MRELSVAEQRYRAAMAVIADGLSVARVHCVFWSRAGPDRRQESHGHADYEPRRQGPSFDVQKAIALERNVLVGKQPYAGTVPAGFADRSHARR
jgi:hypothetical protein